MKLKIILIFCLIFAIAAIIIFGTKFKDPISNHAPNNGPDKTVVKKPENGIVAVTLGAKAPSEFPSAIIPPASAKDIQNTKITDNKNAVSFVQIFKSSDKITALAGYYQKLFESNGWKFRVIIGEPKNKFLEASKGSEIITLMMVSEPDGNNKVQLELRRN